MDKLGKDEKHVMRRRSWPMGPFVANMMNNELAFIASMSYDELVVAASRFVSYKTTSDQWVRAVRCVATSRNI